MCISVTIASPPGMTSVVAMGASLFLGRFVNSGNLFGLFRFHETLQAGEVGLPENAILIQPGIHGAKRFD